MTDQNAETKSQPESLQTAETLENADYQSTDKMSISIFGMGYVGAVTAACLASRGHSVVGVDTNPTKVEMIASGKAPIVEEELPELFEEAKNSGLLTATTDAAAAIHGTEISMICVGTPSNSNGSLDSKYLEAVSHDIALAIKEKEEKHILIYRSTMLPGLLKTTIIPLLERVSGKTEGQDFFVCFNPEFLRESTSVYDFFNPPKTVVGTDSKWVADKVFALYGALPGPYIQTSIDVAEMVKYVDNMFHALKITFANEVGQVCRSLDIDSHAVMNIFVQDTKLNISKAYLKPGFAFGGSCLPKDLRAINYLAKTKDVATPLLNSMLESNHKLIEKAMNEIIGFGKKKVGFAGFSFKAGTDDLRESPMVELIERLIGKGYDIKLYDRYVAIAKLTGANKEYITKSIPHIASLMEPSLDDLLRDCDVIVIGNKDEEFRRLLTDARPDQVIYDLVRINGKFKGQDNHIVIS